MFTVIVNDKKYTVEDGTPLLEILAEHGGSTCKNNDKCGQCVICCSALSISEQDKNALSPQDLEAGMRLAHDKIVKKNLVVQCPFIEKINIRRTLSCYNVFLSIDEDTIDIGISDETVAETNVFFNPLSRYGSYAEQTEKYELDPTPLERLLRDTIKEQIEKIIKPYGKGVANVTSVCANGFYLKVPFGVPLSTKIDDYNLLIGNDTLDLPTEKIYILPPADDLIGGNVFCRSISHKENTLLIDCGKNVTLFYIGKEVNTYGFMWEIDYSPLTLLAIRAAVRVLCPEGYAPIVYLYGEHAYALEELLTAEGLSYVHAKEDITPLYRSCTLTHVRSKLEAEKKRTSFHDLLKDELFQEKMVELQCDTDL